RSDDPIDLLLELVDAPSVRIDLPAPEEQFAILPHHLEPTLRWRMKEPRVAEILDQNSRRRPPHRLRHPDTLVRRVLGRMAELASLYDVLTRALNQAVKRNRDRFPADFMFRLTADEAEELRRSRSQIVTLKRGANVKYLPWAFTEHGALMAATVLNSPRAVEMSVFIVRAFVRLREYARAHTEITKRLDALERRVTDHDDDLREMFDGLRALLSPSPRSGREIGFAKE